MLLVVEIKNPLFPSMPYGGQKLELLQILSKSQNVLFISTFEN